MGSNTLHSCEWNRRDWFSIGLIGEPTFENPIATIRTAMVIPIRKDVMFNLDGCDGKSDKPFSLIYISIMVTVGRW